RRTTPARSPFRRSPRVSRGPAWPPRSSASADAGDAGGHGGNQRPAPAGRSAREMTGSSSHRPVVPSVPGACLAACAVLHELDGYTVVAHYGSVSGEIAVCMKSVGLADRSDFGAGEPLGAAFVGYDALRLLNASPVAAG